jgi:FkbM family methyltransferase
MGVGKLFVGIKENIKDVISLGPGFMRRHLPHGGVAQRIRIAGYGNLHLRTGQSDCAVIRQVFRERQYDLGSIDGIGKRIWNRYTEILNSGGTPIIVDAGANIGAASLWFLTAYPRARVIAIEPEPDNLSILQLNANGKERLTVMAAAVGSTAGFVSVKCDGPGWAARTMRAQAGIPIVTMDSAFRSVERGVPFIAKIDIEGFEKDLFSENLGWLSDVYAVYIEPHDWLLPGQMTSRPFQCALAQHAFELTISGDNLVFVSV